MRQAFLLLLLPHLFFSALFAQNNGRLFDQPMKVKRLSVNIKADAFVATTFLEFEFCNSGDKEMEGLYRFKLHPGQVITAFQLELNGKYRDGSIEEKWKAQNAYNTIVGKRVDPALLSMEQPNQYRINIYPVPAKGCRKVTITIQQLLNGYNGEVQYVLPLSIADTIGLFKLNITLTDHEAEPCAEGGLVGSSRFSRKLHQYELNFERERVFVNDVVRFCVPFVGLKTTSVVTNGIESFFAIRLNPDIPSQYPIHPKKLVVFWDASTSGMNRSTKKEINFLRQYIVRHKIEELTIIPFNDVLQDARIFKHAHQSIRMWVQFLQKLEYDGATQLGCIQLADRPEMVMIFSDGLNTYGSRKPKLNNALTYWIHASTAIDEDSFSSLVGPSGGRLINLNQTSIVDAVELCSKASNWLLDIRSASGPTMIEQDLPIQISNVISIAGRFPFKTDTLYFQYGNYQGIKKVEQVILSADSHGDSTLKRLSMLSSFDRIISSGSWEGILDFGLREHIVSPNTAFIVLERIEDYIKYNIAPPKDLEEECRRLNYVKKDRWKDRKLLSQQNENIMMRTLIDTYNFRLRTWDPAGEWASISNADLSNNSRIFNGYLESNGGHVTNQLIGNVAGLSISRVTNLDEVVVVGYGTVRKKEISGSVAVVNRQELNTYQTVEQALTGRIAGLMVVPSGDPIRDISSIRIRGAAGLGSSGTPLYVLDGMPISGNINDLININDIESIVVLKDIQAAAIYGSRAVNGAIVVHSKKGSRYYRSFSPRRYRLKDLEDVEYMQEIKAAPLKEKMLVYDRLRKEYVDEPGFYLDMAQHFFEHGLKEQAMKTLKNAAELGYGNRQLLRAIGFILESWGNFKAAIIIHQQLVEDLPSGLRPRRDLAWACYQNGEVQRAVDILYEAIRVANDGDLQLKASMLNELNAIIAIHKEELTVSAIPGSMIRPMPVDLRIFLDCNKDIVSYVEIKEPGGQSCTSKNRSKNGGVIYSEEDRYYRNSFADYTNKVLEAGHYRIIMSYHDAYANKIPSVIRIMTFRNFGKKDQSIKVENVMMDNQSGDIEIADFKF